MFWLAGAGCVCVGFVFVVLTTCKAVRYTNGDILELSFFVGKDQLTLESNVAWGHKKNPNLSAKLNDMNCLMQLRIYPQKPFFLSRKQ